MIVLIDDETKESDWLKSVHYNAEISWGQTALQYIVRLQTGDSKRLQIFDLKIVCIWFLVLHSQKWLDLPFWKMQKASE